MKKDFKEIQTHLKETGFVFPNSEIYGGLANTYDYGHLGSLMMKNVKDAWYQEFILKEENNFLIDSKILMNPRTWKASGHIDNFADPLIENKINKKRYRADHIIEELKPGINPDLLSMDEMRKILVDEVKEYDGSKTEWSEIKKFNLMFETYQGVIEEKKTPIFMRPETAQGIFVNFKNVQRATRAKIPFGIGQIGKAFRNEVTPGNFIFRTREFEQMELEYFVKPGEDDKAYEYYINKSFGFIKSLGIDEENLKLKKHPEDALAHYSKGTTDIEYDFPFGWGELMGISNRTDFDLKAHMNESKVSLEYQDPFDNSKYLPYVIEPSVGADRLTLAVLVDAYSVEDERVILKLDKKIAPYKFAILPLNKKFHSEEAKKLFHKLIDMGISVTFDEAGSIGKRYRRQDSIGTPFCLTVIDDTKSKQMITIRHRDDMKQETIIIENLINYL